MDVNLIFICFIVCFSPVTEADTTTMATVNVRTDYYVAMITREVTPPRWQGICNNAINVNGSERHFSTPKSPNGTDQCNMDVRGFGWYRFTSPTSNMHLATQCLKPESCGTDIPLYIDPNTESPLPDVGEQSFMDVCGSTRVYGALECCVMKSKIRVLNCGNDDYVYFITEEYECHTGFCTKYPTERIPNEFLANVVLPIQTTTQTENVTYNCTYKFVSGDSWEDIPGMRCNEAISLITQKLRYLSLDNITTENVASASQKVANITSDPAILSKDAIKYASYILANITNVKGGVNIKTATNALQAVNNILAVNETVINDAENSYQSSSRITKSIEKLTDTIQLDHKETAFELVQSDIAILVSQTTEEEEHILGIRYSQDVEEKLNNNSFSPIKEYEDILQDVDTAILLPQSEVRSSTGAGRRRISFLLYRDWTLFKSQYELNVSSGNGIAYVANSPIISAKINIRPGSTKLKNPVIATFVSANRTDYTSNKTVCGFWDYSLANGQGDWSTEGCQYNGSVGNRHECLCHHLTNFALLLDIAGQKAPIDPDHQQALEIISIIGLSLSIAGLSVTILTYLLFSCRFGTSQTYTLTTTKLRRGRDQQTLFNLALALLCSMIVFLAGVKQTGNYGGCIAVAVLLHYFILVTFMWMLMEGILQYLRFVKVMGTYVSRFIWKAAIPAWGIPAVVCAIVLSIDYNLYKGGDTYCWLGLSALYYAFLIPVGIIILANIIVFILVLRGITCARAHGLQSNQSERSMVLLQFNCAVCCLVLLGCTWLFGFFAIGEARLSFQYLFCIFNSLQGFFIFIFFTIRDERVRNAWCEFCCRKRYYKKTYDESHILQTRIHSDIDPTHHTADSTHTTNIDSV